MILTQQALFWYLILASVVFTYWHPESLSGPLCLLISATLLGVSLYFKNVSEAEQETRGQQIESLEGQIRALKERVDTALFQKGMGR